MIKIIPKGKKCKKAKRLSEEALQIAKERREVKGKGEKKRCKEIEENNRMGKTRDLFKKIRDIKGTFHAKVGIIKDRDSMDLTKAKILRIHGKDTQKN